MGKIQFSPFSKKRFQMMGLATLQKLIFLIYKGTMSSQDSVCSTVLQRSSPHQSTLFFTLLTTPWHPSGPLGRRSGWVLNRGHYEQNDLNSSPPPTTTTYVLLAILHILANFGCHVCVPSESKGSISDKRFNLIQQTTNVFAGGSRNGLLLLCWLGNFL